MRFCFYVRNPLIKRAMFSQLSSLSIPKFGFGRSTTTGKIDIPQVKIINVETEPDKRSRRLKHLIKLNHSTFSILYHNLQFHNHTPHILGSAYLLGGSADHLNDIYDNAAETEGHEPWKDSPSEIALHDYRDYLGLREYQRAWVDFFEDQLATGGDYEWKNVVAKFLFEEGSKQRPNPVSLIYSLVDGLAHPLIHLGYAFELNSKEIAMEALGLAATCYDPKLAGLIEKNIPKISNTTANALTYSTSNPFEVLARVNGDTRLNDLFTHPGGDNLSKLLADERLISIVLEHWSAWKVTDPKKQFEDSQKLAVAIVLSTAPDWGGHGYDFFLVHLLTSSHAVRIVLPMIDAKYHLILVREWFFIVIAIYIAQMRPVISTKKISDIQIGDKGWRYAEDLALAGKHKFDAHYVKAIRAMKEAAAVWGDDSSWYVRAAVKFAGEFEGWGGFGREEEETHPEGEKKQRRGSFN